MINIDKIYKKIETQRPRSAWAKGVKIYALELLESCEQKTYDSIFTLKSTILNGAKNWDEHSCNGYSLIYDVDIAQRLCTPSELKRTRDGKRRPNNRELWVNTQGRALYQAWELIKQEVVKC